MTNISHRRRLNNTKPLRPSTAVTVPAKTGIQRAMEYSTQAAKAAGGGDVDPELCKLWKLLNKDAQA
jgi:hypothetical protein